MGSSLGGNLTPIELAYRKSPTSMGSTLEKSPAPMGSS